MTTPCADPANDPNDWFIGRDGKQYGDEEFLTADEKRRITRSVLAIEGETPERHAERVQRAITIVHNDRRRASLQKRRHARDKCREECSFRTKCLTQAMEEPTPATHGTWGGYYEEELAEIRKRSRRR